MSEAWVYQKPDDVRKLGEEKAPYLVGWYDPDGRRRSKTCGEGKRGKKIADRLAEKTTAELMTGTYEKKSTIIWDDFVKEYDRRILEGREYNTRKAALISLAHFKRIIKPVRIFAIDTGHMDDFIAARRKEPGTKKNSVVSPATVNHDLRHIKAALKQAEEWGYIGKVPRCHMEKVPKKLVRYMTPEHFAAIYAACDRASLPRDLPYPAADWWRGLLTLLYMTGWRIGDALELRRDDLDLEAGYAITMAEDNKGDRDDKVKLHPVVIEHLRRLASFETNVFPFSCDRCTIDVEFDRIQVAAGINLSCPKRHEHADSCHVYGFHDIRRAFATLNATRLTPDALQALMRHKSYTTTQVYINLARQVDDAVDLLHVPEVLKKNA